MTACQVCWGLKSALPDNNAPAIAASDNAASPTNRKIGRVEVNEKAPELPPAASQHTVIRRSSVLAAMQKRRTYVWTENLIHAKFRGYGI
jgi:hypothetical protein